MWASKVLWWLQCSVVSTHIKSLDTLWRQRAWIKHPNSASVNRNTRPDRLGRIASPGLEGPADISESGREVGARGRHPTRGRWQGLLPRLPGAVLSPVLTAPVNAIPTLFATVRARLGRFRPVKTASSGAPAATGGGFDGTEPAGTRSNGRKQGRNSADRCGEDRVLLPCGGPSGRSGTGRGGSLNSCSGDPCAYTGGSTRDRHWNLGRWR